MNPFTSIDYAAAWVELQKDRRKPDDSAYWDMRAETFGGSDRPSSYADEFIARLMLRPEDSIFDMGCGTGALALPLARAGHQVIGADFSAGMLERMSEEAVKHAVSGNTGLQNVDVHRFAWEDDWSVYGVTDKCVDVAVASRSIVVADLAVAIDKLSRVARRKVAITLSTDGSPRSGGAILRAIGRGPAAEYDVLFALVILWQKGYLPSVDYIGDPRISHYPTPEEVFLKTKRDIPDLTNEEEEKLHSFIDAHIVPVEEHGVTYWMLDYKRNPTWAFISWQTNGACTQ